MTQKIRKSLALFVCAAVLAVSPVFAANLPEQLIPVGRAVGIRLHTDGVLVAEVGSVETEHGKVSPAEQAGLQTGDLILSINGKTLQSNAEFQQIVETSAGKPLSMLTQRGMEERVLTVSAVRDLNGQYRLGILIRDGISGIGTVTFVDPETGRYGSLGHGICDGESGTLIPLGTGDLIEASVERVQKGAVGEPGALQGSFDATDMLGTVEKNTVHGIFGVMEDQELIEGLQPVPVADPGEIHTGECVVLSNVSDTEVRPYQAEIVKVFRDGNEVDASLMLHITDDALVSQTGGIVQGMGLRDIRDNTRNA